MTTVALLWTQTVALPRHLGALFSAKNRSRCLGLPTVQSCALPLVASRATLRPLLWGAGEATLPTGRCRWFHLLTPCPSLSFLFHFWLEAGHDRVLWVTGCLLFAFAFTMRSSGYALRVSVSSPTRSISVVYLKILARRISRAVSERLAVSPTLNSSMFIFPLHPYLCSDILYAGLATALWFVTSFYSARDLYQIPHTGI